ncbi:hypothetical protein H310_12409 [Aphanomyces invadans]|uniref:TFA2 Winged helix domain-containing protein n=1 Tax=Aphanomyces invadans TaxID=157072 RepID=A0A024TJ38_9STRA|nr:hypothetical protein H310_12409 [Aphanomyces invadans]ETV93626.1 hypothetical protein H310_12409 [Aphanomyces invadans]|eukprot:XP_008877668.1 hypothetical protein H310_12409 [Aphanomyces invadans]
MWKTLAYNKAVPEPKAPESTDPGVSEVAPKDVPETVVGRLQKVLEYLNSIANHAAVTVPQIYQKTGIDLASPGEYEVCDRVRNNPKVRIEGDKIAYKAKFDIKSRNDVLRQLNRSPEGIPFRDLKDCYKNVEDDLRDLTRIGTVICIRNTEDGNDVYYPRGAQFLVELSGTGLVEHGCYMVATKEDITNEVRRGDAVKVGDHWFRVSAAPKTGGGSSQPQMFMAGMASKSVSSVRDLNLSATKKTRYHLNFDAGHLPLDTAYPDPRGNVSMLQRWDAAPKPGRGLTVPLLKHGCTNDVRQLWRDTLRDWPADRLSLERKLLQCGLMTRDMHEANLHRSKMRKVHGKGNKKVMRQRKQRDIKITNTHLVGTALGEALAKGGNDSFTLGSTQYQKS